MSSNQASVFVVDDDAATVDSLRYLLESSGYRVRSYIAARDFLADYDPANTGCLVLDDRMPEMSGRALIEELRARGATIPIVLVTAYPELEFAVDAMKHGAVDFLRKPWAEDRLLAAVERAFELEREREQRLALRRDYEGRIARLTPREREVMERVVAGKTNRAIACELGITERTVEMHRFQMKKKMGAETIADLVRLATQYDQTHGG